MTSSQTTTLSDLQSLAYAAQAEGLTASAEPSYAHPLIGLIVLCVLIITGTIAIIREVLIEEYEDRH